MRNEYGGLKEYVEKFSLNDRIDIDSDGNPRTLLLLHSSTSTCGISTEIIEGLEKLQIRAMKELFNSGLTNDGGDVVVNVELMTDILNVYKDITGIDIETTEGWGEFKESRIKDKGFVNFELMHIVMLARQFKKAVPSDKIRMKWETTHDLI